MENILIDNERIVIGVPFEKVDVKQRTVEGFATLDNVDKVGDVIDYEASKKAFAEWPGNIREMHQKKAVGKAVGIVEKTLTDADGTTYNGFWVKARISKGAQDTWEKILDGTLTGFSVGGHIVARKSELDKSSGKSVSRITDYVLSELSVVDNPCNMLSGFALIKSADGIFTIEDSVDDLLEDEEDFVEELEKKTFDTAQRKADAKSGAAEPDGSFPINNATDLKNAIRDWGRAGAKASDKAHIISRAKSLGLTNLLPEDWGVEKAASSKNETTMYGDATNDNIKGKHDATDHLDMAYDHMNQYADHVRNGNHPARDDHAARTLQLAGDISDHKRSAQYHAESMAGPMAGHPMQKDGDLDMQDLQENKNSDISDNNNLNLSDEEKGLFRKFIDFIKGTDASETEDMNKSDEVNDVNVENKDLNKDIEGGNTPEMDKDTLKEVLGELVVELQKSTDEKFAAVGESLSKVDERLGAVAGTDALDEIKTLIEELGGRVAALEDSGAVKKSADGAGSGSEELKKSNSEGFWSDSIVPEFLKAKFGN